MKEKKRENQTISCGSNATRWEKCLTKPIMAEGDFGSDNLTSAFLEPVISEADIDYSLVYALFTFVASMEGQICVLKGEPLELLDDSNSYW